LWLTNPILGKFKGKNKILSIDNLLCRTFATVCRNSDGNLRRLSRNCDFLARRLI